jgi:ABC-type dipeptide/oligopeptide/nickel transport system permease component
MTARYGDAIPAWQQYLTFMKGALTWDLGYSYQYPQFTVQQLIARAFPVSATLALCAMFLALLIAIPLGVLAAARQNSPWDVGGMLVVTVGHALPNYLAGIGMVLIFSSALHLLPTGGWGHPENLIMPVIALAIGPAGVLARYVRSSMLESLREEYLVTARAKGGSPRTVIVRHALRNSLIPLVTVAGPQLASLLTGTIFVEAVFGIPGLGTYFASAARFRDMPLLMGTTLFFAAVLMVINLLVDLAYAYLDPRTRAGLGLVRVARAPARGAGPLGPDSRVLEGGVV